MVPEQTQAKATRRRNKFQEPAGRCPLQGRSMSSAGNRERTRTRQAALIRHDGRETDGNCIARRACPLDQERGGPLDQERGGPLDQERGGPLDRERGRAVIAQGRMHVFCRHIILYHRCISSLNLLHRRWEVLTAHWRHVMGTPWGMSDRGSCDGGERIGKRRMVMAAVGYPPCSTV